MSKKIVIDADLKKVTQSFKRAFSEVEKMAPKKMSMGFDFDNIKKWKSSNVDAFKSAVKGLEESKNKMKEFASLQKEAARSGKKVGEDIAEGFLKASEAAKRYAREISDIQKQAKTANFLQRLGARMRSGAEGGGEGGGGDSIGAAIGSAGDIAGMMGPWGAVAKGVVNGYMAARRLAAPRRALAGQNLEFTGLSNRQQTNESLGQLRRAGVEQGFTAEESMGAAVGLQRQAGEVDYGSLRRFSQLRRATGLGAEELTGMTGSLRAAAVDKKGTSLEENLDKIGKIYSQATASALDKTGALRYLQITSQMITQVADEGSADINAIKDTLSELSMQSDFYKANPARAAAAFKGGEDFFKSGQGTGLALRSMQGVGLLGNKGPMEALMMQQMGFSGGQFSVGGKQFGGIGRQGLEETVRQVASAAAGITRDNFKDASREQVSGAINALAKTMNLSPSNAGKLLEASLGKQQVSEKDLEEMMKAPADKTNDLLDKQIKVNEASFHEVIMTLGEKIAAPMASIEGNVAKIANHILGVSGPQTQKDFREKRKDLEEQAKRGRGSLSGWAESLVGMDPDSRIEDAAAEGAKKGIKEGGVLDSDEANSLYNKMNNPYVSGLADKSADQLPGGKYLPGDESMIYQELMNVKSQRDQLKNNISEQEKTNLSYGKGKDEGLGSEQELVKRFDALVQKLSDALDKKADKNFMKSQGYK